MKKYDFLGIDPGLTKSGIAVYNVRSKEIAEVNSLDLFELEDYLFYKVCDRFGVILELPSLDSTVFASDIYKQIANGKGATAIRSFAKRSQKVGANKAVGNLILELLIKSGKDFAVIAPSDRMRSYADDYTPQRSTSGKRKIKRRRLDPGRLTYPTKTTAEQFKDLTGFEDKSNEHERDAATLVWKMTEPKFQLLKGRTSIILDAGKHKI